MAGKGKDAAESRRKIFSARPRNGAPCGGGIRRCRPACFKSHRNKGALPPCSLCLCDLLVIFAFLNSLFLRVLCAALRPLRQSFSSQGVAARTPRNGAPRGGGIRRCRPACFESHRNKSGFPPCSLCDSVPSVVIFVFVFVFVFVFAPGAKNKPPAGVALPGECCLAVYCEPFPDFASPPRAVMTCGAMPGPPRGGPESHQQCVVLSHTLFGNEVQDRAGGGVGVHTGSRCRA